jgi:hemerythrin-like domain-containing protein
MHTHDLQGALSADHRRLDALFEELLNRVHVDDREAIQTAWNEFEVGLLAHMEVEEHCMIPLLERETPTEAVEILAEHAQIRKMLAEIGVGLQIHIVREETVERFVAFLRNHAAREDAMFYRWAEVSFDEVWKDSILERLARHQAGHARSAAA